MYSSKSWHVGPPSREPLRPAPKPPELSALEKLEQMLETITNVVFGVLFACGFIVCWPFWTLDAQDSRDEDSLWQDASKTGARFLTALCAAGIITECALFFFLAVKSAEHTPLTLPAWAGVCLVVFYAALTAARGLFPLFRIMRAGPF